MESAGLQSPRAENDTYLASPFGPAPPRPYSPAPAPKALQTFFTL